MKIPNIRGINMKFIIIVRSNNETIEWFELLEDAERYLKRFYYLYNDGLRIEDEYGIGYYVYQG